MMRINKRQRKKRRGMNKIDLTKNSYLLRLFAEANRKCGYDDYAKTLENAAVVYEAREVLEEEHG
mgnify:CR=1 FL=1